MASLLYVFFAGLVAAAAWLIFLTPQALYAVLGLLGVMLGMAALYFLQGAALVAVAQVLVYGGGVLILILFSTWLLPFTPQPTPPRPPWLLGLGLAGGLGALLGPMVYLAGQSLEQQTPIPPHHPTDAVADIGLQLMGPYALAFEWAGLVLLVALVGAVCCLPTIRRG